MNINIVNIYHNCINANSAIAIVDTVISINIIIYY